MANSFDYGLSLIPSTATSVSGTTLDTSITSPVLISTISLDTVTPTVEGSSITTQNISSIGLVNVQNNNEACGRFLIPVITSSTNVVSFAEIYYTSAGYDLAGINFTATLKVLGI